MHENEIVKIIFAVAVKVHKQLGPGLFESTYQTCMAYELRKQGLLVEEQKVLPLVYEDICLDKGYRIDILVESKVIVELKAIEVITDVHRAQILTYLKLSGCKLGLLINFNVPYMGKGVQRFINGIL